MTRIFDFTVIGVVSIISSVIHLMAVELFAPESPLHEVASGATNLDGATRADLWFEILSIWVPLLAIGGILAWGMVREYRRQVSTAMTRGRP